MPIIISHRDNAHRIFPYINEMMAFKIELNIAPWLSEIDYQ